jgi:hypothetical protein
MLSLFSRNFVKFYERGTKFYDVLFNIWKYSPGKDYVMPNISLLALKNSYSKLKRKLSEDSKASVINQSNH